MSNWDWGKFIKATQKRQPVSFLVEAVKILGISKGKALDIGCGAGIDSKYLAENRFQVEAVDSDNISIEQTKKLCSNLPVIIIKKDVADYDIVPLSYQLIIAWNILPFLIKEKSYNLLIKIQEGLVKDGIFVFSVLGREDDWAKTHPEMSFWTIEELKSLLTKMDFIKILEEKQKKAGATGEIKFWHLIQGIIQKKS